MLITLGLHLELRSFVRKNAKMVVGDVVAVCSFHLQDQVTLQLLCAIKNNSWLHFGGPITGDAGLQLLLCGRTCQNMSKFKKLSKHDRSVSKIWLQYHTFETTICSSRVHIWLHLCTF